MASPLTTDHATHATHATYTGRQLPFRTRRLNGIAFCNGVARQTALHKSFLTTQKSFCPRLTTKCRRQSQPWTTRCNSKWMSVSALDVSAFVWVPQYLACRLALPVSPGLLGCVWWVLLAVLHRQIFVHTSELPHVHVPECDIVLHVPWVSSSGNAL